MPRQWDLDDGETRGVGCVNAEVVETLEYRSCLPENLVAIIFTVPLVDLEPDYRGGEGGDRQRAQEQVEGVATLSRLLRGVGTARKARSDK